MSDRYKFSFIANKMAATDYADTVTDVQCLIAQAADAFGFMHELLLDQQAKDYYPGMSAVLELCQRGMKDVLRTEGAMLSQMALALRHAAKEEVA